MLLHQTIATIRTCDINGEWSHETLEISSETETQLDGQFSIRVWQGAKKCTTFFFVQSFIMERRSQGQKESHSARTIIIANPIMHTTNHNN